VTTSHVVVITDDQARFRQDGVAFVDIDLHDFLEAGVSTDPAAVLSIHHSAIPRFIEQLVAHYGDLKKEQTP
jgi:hypothetical protein